MAQFKRAIGNSIPKVVEELPNGCISIREEGDAVGEGLIFSVESAYDLEDALEAVLGISDAAEAEEAEPTQAVISIEGDTEGQYTTYTFKIPRAARAVDYQA